MDNWIDLSNLPKNSRGNISWSTVKEGVILNFLFNNVLGSLKYIKTNNRNSIVEYNGDIFMINSASLSNCKLSNIVYNKTIYKIGDVVEHKHGSFRILNIITSNRTYYIVKCSNCGSEHKVQHSSIHKNLQKEAIGCVGCSNKIPLIGHNTIYDTDKWMLKYINEEDARKYTSGSSAKIKAKCDKCGNEKIITINSLKRRGFSCNVCSCGVSYPERLMSSILNNLNIKYIYQYGKTSSNWCGKYKYDFYLPDYNCIIEMMGEGHYREKPSWNKTLKDTEFNDDVKKHLALKNNIKSYIVVDCKVSEFNYIIKNIKLSKFSEIINIENLNYEIVRLNSMNSRVFEVCEFYMKHKNMKLEKIGHIFNHDRKTILNYIREGSIIFDWFECDKKYLNLKKRNYKIIVKYKNKEYEYDSFLQLEKNSENVFGIKIPRNTASRCEYLNLEYKGFSFFKI